MFLVISQSLPVIADEFCPGGNAVTHLFIPVWDSGLKKLSYPMSIVIADGPHNH
jgi:hypothetical protein